MLKYITICGVYIHNSRMDITCAYCLVHEDMLNFEHKIWIEYLFTNYFPYFTIHIDFW